VLVLLVAAGYAAYDGLRHLLSSPPLPACQAGAGAQAISLDTDQAAIAATIAGVAARHRLPRRAVTIAYAAALQESKLHDLSSGDRDSVGVFQQRPSQGWGTAAQLQDPVYATTRFFAALVQVKGYATMPVDRAAQAVQHSADGSAYQQYQDVASLLAGYFTGASPHGVSCWYSPGGAAADLTGAVRAMTGTFGPQGREHVLVGVTRGRSVNNKDGRGAVVHAQPDAAWTVASWLVAHAQDYRLSEVRYAGYQWKAADGTTGWRRVPGALAHGSIVAG
jgi:hypothetical protein